MDLLKKEMERKKKAMALAKEKSGGGSRRFMKAADLRRNQEEEEDRMRSHERSNNKRNRPVSDENDKASNRKEEESSDAAAPPAAPAPTNNNINKKKQKKALSAAQVKTRLREFRLPIQLFGEKLEERVKRLEAAVVQQTSQSKTTAEMDEFRLGQGHSIRNPFLEKRKGSSTLEEEDQAEDKEEEAAAAAKKEEEEEEEDTSNDPHKRIYRYLKGLLKQWEEDLALRPDAVKRTVAGKNETKTLKQCKDYIRPLFKLCKTRKLEEGLEKNLLKIVNYCQEGEFVKAHDSYLDLAIGRAAWPIGVTMVGIHARSGRAKIESSNVAHVMNSELQRKYLTSVKRLMSYAQKKATHVDPSRKVMNWI